MTGRGLVTTQAGLPGDIALPSSCAKPSEAGAADLADRLGPDLARCAPTSSPPGARGPQFSGPAAATCLEKAGMQRRGGRGQPSCGPEELPPQRRKPPPGLRLPRANSGSWGVGELPSFPSMSSSLFFLSADGSPESPSTARGCGPQRTELPAGPFPLFRGLIFSSIPTHSNPGAPHPKWAKDSEAPYF